MPGIGSQSETQDKGKGIVHGSKLVSVEAAGGTPEALGIDDRGLLDKDARLGSVKLDRRAKRG